MESPTLWIAGPWEVHTIDQTRLPFAEVTLPLLDAGACHAAIVQMQVRGAPLIGAVGAFGTAFAVRDDASDEALEAAIARLVGARPTAVNLRWAVERVAGAVRAVGPAERVDVAWGEAVRIAEEDVTANRKIGEHGAALLEPLIATLDGARPLRILTHCNAGRLATVAHGTALAPVYELHRRGVPLHIWVDETRPRNQGAALTAWELAQVGIPHTVIADNAGGLLMQRGEVDAVLVGCDRVAANGDVANKVGTYLKALAAHDHGIPFYVLGPRSTLDATTPDGASIVIEERDGREVTHAVGRRADGMIDEVQLVPDGSTVANPGFDITPARYVTALVTEQGVHALDPEYAIRVAIVDGARRLRPLALSAGTSGNLSHRWTRDGVPGMLITPSAVPYEQMTPEMVVWMPLDESSVVQGRPSSEWRMHRDIYMARPEIKAVVHAHPPHATALAVLPEIQRDGIPAFHYMVAVAGGDDIRCAPYATFGTQALSDHAVTALADRRACLLANHGILALGGDVAEALALAVEVETLAQMYAQARVLGTPVILGADEMRRMQAKFADYQRGRLT
ncbi:MAG: S-methyl-5-thioribose-1-phosphate isomerase [Gemmatimonadaceae bacterium]